MYRWIKKTIQIHFQGKEDVGNLRYFVSLYRPANFKIVMTEMQKLLRLENSNLVRWVTLNAYKIFWSCLILSLSFKTFNVVDQLKANSKNSNLKVDSSEGVENLEWWETVIENYWLTVVFFGVMYFVIRIRRRKKGLIWSYKWTKNTHSWHHTRTLIGCFYIAIRIRQDQEAKGFLLVFKTSLSARVDRWVRLPLSPAILS